MEISGDRISTYLLWNWRVTERVGVEDRLRDGWVSSGIGRSGCAVACSLGGFASNHLLKIVIVRINRGCIAVM